MKRLYLRTMWLVLATGIVAGASMSAIATPAGEAHCRAVGAAAGRIAVLRDAGRSQDEAVASVAVQGGVSDTAALRSSAALLYARFRRMEPENAEFEFYLDCLDDEGGATPASPGGDKAVPR